jgi:hypothetical protein
MFPIGNQMQFIAACHLTQDAVINGPGCWQAGRRKVVAVSVLVRAVKLGLPSTWTAKDPMEVSQVHRRPPTPHQLQATREAEP